jgi:hypothetical protein
VLFANITMEGYQCPAFLRHGCRLSGSVARQGYAGDGDALQGVSADSGGAAIGESRTYEDVTLSQIVGRDLGPYPIIACGYPDAPLRRLTLRDITVHHAEAATEADSPLPSNYNDAGYPGPRMFGSKLPAYGLFTRLVEDLVVENLRAIPAHGDPRPARRDA